MSLNAGRSQESEAETSKIQFWITSNKYPAIIGHSPSISSDHFYLFAIGYLFLIPYFYCTIFLNFGCLWPLGPPYALYRFWTYSICVIFKFIPNHLANLDDLCGVGHQKMANSRTIILLPSRTLTNCSNSRCRID